MQTHYRVPSLLCHFLKDLNDNNEKQQVSLYPQADKLLVGGLVDKTTGRQMKSLFFLNDTAKTAYTQQRKTGHLLICLIS